MDNSTHPQLSGRIAAQDLSYDIGTSHPQLKDSFLHHEAPIPLASKDAWADRANDAKLKKEFQLLRMVTETRDHQAELLYQKNLAAFNRYCDIIPFRSRIPPVQPNQNTSEFTPNNYINACFMRDVFNFDHAYISSQGPLDNSVSNFWRMIFTNRCAAIVMLCKLEDQRGPQCAKYWPDHNKSFTVADNIKVTNHSVKKDKTFINSEIVLEQGQERHVCQHIQWEGWPDHGVPSVNGFETITKLCDIINSYLAKKETVTVHCSAGVGRTGTLIACAQLKQILDYYEKNPESAEQGLSVFSIIRRMREQRIYMVMHYEQYRFVYEYIVDQLKRFAKK